VLNLLCMQTNLLGDAACGITCSCFKCSSAAAAAIAAMLAAVVVAAKQQVPQLQLQLQQV